jgi:hypothetical protein
MPYGDKVSIHADDIKKHGQNVKTLKEDYLDYSGDQLDKIEVKPGDFADADELKTKVGEIVTAAQTFLTNSGNAAVSIGDNLIANADYYQNTNAETKGEATDFDKIAKDVAKDLPGYEEPKK